MAVLIEVFTGFVNRLPAPLPVLAALAAAVSALVCLYIQHARVTSASLPTDAADALGGDSLRHFYRQMLGRFLHALDRFFGATVSWQSFNRCCQIAFLYPILLIVVAWSMGGPSAFDGRPLLPAGLSLGVRLGIAVLLVAASIAVFVLFINSGRIGQALAGPAERPFLARAIGVASMAAAILLAGVVTGLITRSPTLVLVGAAAGVVALTGAWLGRTVIGAALAAAFLVVVATAGYVDSRAAAIIILLYFILPLINGLADWGSWIVSRVLFSWMLVAERWLKLLWHMVVDFLFAILFLVGVSVLLIVGLTFYSKLLARLGMMPFPWLPYAEAAVRSPFGEGLFVSSMLFSTLVPTILHFAIASLTLLFWPIISPSWVERHILGAGGRKMTAWEFTWIFAKVFLPIFLATSLAIAPFFWLVTLWSWLVGAAGNSLIELAQVVEAALQ